MRNPLRASRPNLRLLLATSSVTALLIGGGAPSAYAGAPCQPPGGIAVSGSQGGVSNSAAISCIFIGNATINGSVTNTGTGTIDTALGAPSPFPTAITISNSTITGAVSNAGTITATSNGILVTNNATVLGGISNSGTISSQLASGIFVGGSASGALASVTVSAFSGGITNSGLIGAGEVGIVVGGLALRGGSVTISTFLGGISNSGTIGAGLAGILVGTVDSGIGTVTVSTFSGGITNTSEIFAFGGIVVDQVVNFINGNISNSGTIFAGSGGGIVVNAVTNFTGNISNNGTIQASGTGIVVDNTATFTGSISNSGTIAVGETGIVVGCSCGISTFAGNIINSGTIQASGIGILVTHVTTFTGGIANSGMIGAGATGIAVNNVAIFSGNISNAGTISSTGTGIRVVIISTFTGGLTNSGTISVSSAGGPGIWIDDVGTVTGSIVNSAGGTVSAPLGGIFVVAATTFLGGITNAGLILASENGPDTAGDGVVVTQITQFGSSSAGGGITNSGFISSAQKTGISINDVTSLYGGISNSGTISAGGAGVFVNNVSTFSGNISNSGTIIGNTGINVFNSVNFAAGSGIVNSGIITGTGGPAINVASAAGAVTVTQNAGTITGDIKLISLDDTLNVNGGAINGNIVGRGAGGGGDIEFTLGSGTFTYAAAYGFNGFDNVNINSGTVVLNGANSAAAVDVIGGTLAGTGSIDPTTVTIHSGATFAPGSTTSPLGTFGITGNLVFDAGSLYAIRIEPGAGNNSKAVVNGTATLNGSSTVMVTPQLGHYTGEFYTILAPTTLNGTFSPTVTVNGDFNGTATLNYIHDPGDVDLNITGFQLLAAPSGSNQNQQNVATGLNQAILAGDTIPPGFTNLGNLSGPVLLNALTQLDGEVATGAQTGSFQLMTDFLNLMLDPTAAGGGGSDGAAPGFADEEQSSLPPDIALAYAAMLHKAPPLQTLEQRWSAWGSAFGGANKTDGDPATGANNVTASDFGFAAGMDYRVTPQTRYGFALAGGGTNWNVAQSLGSGRGDAFQAGVYGTTHFGPAYVSAALAFANHWFSTSRIAMGDNLTAKFDGQSYAARFEGGYRYGLPVTGYIIGVTPYAAVQVQDFHTPGYSETDLTGGGFGVTYNAANATDTRSELGARFDNLTVWNGRPLILRGRLAWAHDWVDNPSLGAAFQALPGSSFTVNGAAPPKNSALASAGAEWHMTANWSLQAKFDGEFAESAQTYAGTGTLRYSW